MFHRSCSSECVQSSICGAQECGFAADTVGTWIGCELCHPCALKACHASGRWAQVHTRSYKHTSNFQQVSVLCIYLLHASLLCQSPAWQAAAARWYCWSCKRLHGMSPKSSRTDPGAIQRARGLPFLGPRTSACADPLFHGDALMARAVMSPGTRTGPFWVRKRCCVQQSFSSPASSARRRALAEACAPCGRLGDACDPSECIVTFGAIELCFHLFQMQAMSTEPKATLIRYCTTRAVAGTCLHLHQLAAASRTTSGTQNGTAGRCLVSESQLCRR